eukprot:9288724-Pyramimonas_sp.AAC.1
MQGHWKVMPTPCERGAANEGGQGWAGEEGCKGNLGKCHSFLLCGLTAHRRRIGDRPPMAN